MKELNWVILGCGSIAKEFAQAMQDNGKQIYAVANRTPSKAIEFAQKYNIEKVYENIKDVFSDNKVDIIYLSTPHNTHIDYIIQALNSGKHVLCEKAITLNSSQLRSAINLADKNQLILAEAMTLYHMPLFKKLHEITNSGKLGDLRMIQLNFGSFKEYDMNNRFFNPNLAGGALLDIGVYALSCARWFMSEKPNKIHSQVKFAPSGVDEQIGILLMNNAQEMATISITLHAKQPKRAVIAYEKGYIEIYDYPRADKAVIVYTQDTQTQTIEVGSTSDALYYEIIDMEKAVSGECNEMFLDFTADVMDIMTDIRAEWKLYYPEEIEKK